MKKNIILILTILIAGLSIYQLVNKKPEKTLTCNDELGCVHFSKKEAIKLGVIQDLSSRAAPFGIDQVRSFKIALSERGSKLLDHPVELIIEDSKCLPEHGVIAARRMISNPKIVAILGTTCSNSAIKVSKIVSKAGYTMISGSNSAASLTYESEKQGKNWHEGFFRTMFSTDTSGAAAAKFVFTELNIRKAAVVHDGDIYTKGYADKFIKKFDQLGGTIALTGIINKGESNMEPVLNAIQASGAELIFIPIFNEEGIHFVKQKVKMNSLKHVPLLGGNALINDTFINGVQKDGIGMYFLSIAPSSDSPELQNLVSAFHSDFGEPPKSTLYDYGYDAMNVLLDTLEKTFETDKNNNLVIGRKALREALYGVRQYKGITGILNTTKFGDMGIARFMVVALEDPQKGASGLKSNVKYTISNAEELK